MHAVARASRGLLVALLLAPAAFAGPFDECESRFRSEPDVYESSYCFYLVAQREQLWDEAAAKLDALRSEHRDNHWLTLVRGGLEWTRNLELAEALFGEAASGFAAQANARGEVQARRSLRTILFRQGRIEDAAEEVRLALGAAESSDDPLALAQALTLEATHLTDTGTDLGRAYRSLRRASVASRDGGYTLQRATIFALANLCFRTGRLDEALGHYRELVRMAREAGDKQADATAQYGVVNTLLEQLEETPDPARRSELVEMSERALSTAVEVDNREVQVLLHRVLGNLLGSSQETAPLARQHFERCISLGRSIDQPRELGHCLWSLGRFLADEDPAGARHYVDEALTLARETGHSWSLAFAARQRMRLSWKTETEPRAIDASREALAAVEALRDLQEDEGGSASVFSAWTRDYYWLSGRLFERAESRGGERELELGFDVVERMRARVLLERLEAARSAPVSRDDPAVARREQVLREIVDVHRRLLDPALTPDARQQALRSLERLEVDEEELRARIERAGSSRVATASFATLSEVASHLAPDEALLSFQLALWRDLYGEFGGGSWLLVVTREGGKLHRLPDRAKLRAGLPLFVGLFGRRDGSERPAAAALYRELLAEAIDALPPGIERLILVPDGELHRVPFTALRPEAAEAALAERYEVSVVPSATLWLKWRQEPAPPPELEALVLADPAVEGANGGPAAERSWDLSPGDLGALPYARREGRAIEGYLGEGTRLLVGESASEHALKASDLAPFRVLHFAAHAVVDEERPERSAVVLAPGGRDEDGLLQTREIVDLDLEGKLIVLSACRSASGRLLSGEGVMGLARAFFEGGARTVVGSLWPLRDDEAALLFDHFYEGLAAGESVDAALKRARGAALRDGLPAAAWSSLVTMGDGSAVAFPGGRRPGSPTPLWPVTLAAALAGGLLLYAASRRRRGAR